MLNFVSNIDGFVSTFFVTLVKDIPILYNIFEYITFFASFEFVASFAVLFTIYFCFKRNIKKYVFPFLSSILLSTIISFQMKYYFDTTGPLGRTLLEFDPSFPSAHSSASVAFYGVIYLLFKNKIKNKFHKKVFLIFTISIIILIGFSRLTLNVHYLSDVLAGYLVGALSLCIAMFITKKINL